MASPFAASFAKLCASTDKAFGEQFTFVARKPGADVDAPTVADGDRANFNATGIWDGPSQAVYPKARGAKQDDSAQQRHASMPSVSVMDAALVWRPRKGDVVIRLDGGATYQIEVPSPDGIGRTVFFLTAKKR